jgi:NAD(P)-dependent dehydrogenase (short-subunit alcohol dehydrogenase family)
MGGTGGVVVTGAARGIGEAIVRHLADDGRVIVGVDLDLDGLEATIASLPGEGHLALAGNAADEDLLQAACDAAVAAGGQLDAFVANAGLARPGDSVKYSRASWEELLTVNLTAPFLGARAARRAMTNGGSIVMISSINALLGMGGRAAYCAAKAGVLGLVRSLAVEWAPDGVRVNSVAPGTIETEMGRQFIASGYATLEMFTSRVPMAHQGQPEDIAAAVSFLCSDGARYITGVVLPVDGGWAINGLGNAAAAS